MKITLTLLSMLFTGCVSERAENTECQNLCDILVQDCAYSAYPTLTSCWEGCAFAQEQDEYDVDGHTTCVEGANCDTFAILECSHEYEVESE